MNTICIPLHPDGGKYKDNSELRYALRSIERNFVGEFEIAIVAKKLPDWIQGVRHIHGDGLKSSLRSAAKELPDGFFWWYDDNCLLLPTDAETMKRTPAAGGWSKPVTDWRKQLEKVRARLVEEGLPALDYSSPHGPYWFDLSMIEEAFADWPGMSGKFPVESWILSKRNWPSTKGETRQYYGAFKKPPGTGHRYLNYNDTGNTEALRRFLEGIFHMQSRFEKPDPEFTYTGRVRGVVIGMKHRPRWETQCIESMTAAGIDAEVFHGTDMHMGDVPAMPVNAKLFAKEFKRQPLAGEIGCYSSHVRVCKEFQNLPALSEQRPGWRLVFEDDALPVNITAASLDAIVAIAEAGGYDLVLLNTGKKNRRGNRGMSISPSRRKDTGTYAYVLNEKAAKEISGWTMRHPIDLAISKSNKLKIGLLGGKFRFSHRPPRESTESIHRERAGEKVFIPATPLNRSKIIHQVWVQGEALLPDAYQKNRKLWAESFPDYQMILWDEESAGKEWPDFKKFSASCYHHATRADMILARAVRDFGGLATGTDCVPVNVTRLRAILETLDNFVVITPGRDELSNGLQWSSTPQHPFWDAVCKHQVRDNGIHLSRKSVTLATGPKCYMSVFNSAKWDLYALTAPNAFTRDWKKEWTNPNGLIDPGFAASWTK